MDINKTRDRILNQVTDGLKFEKKVETVQAGRGRPKINVETKKRVSLALYKSSYEKLQKIAYVRRESASGIVSKLIEDYVNGNQDKLEEYEKIRNK